MGNASSNRQEDQEHTQAGDYQFPEQDIYVAMRKQEADAIKEEFIGDLDHKDALELMSEEELEDSLSILNLIEHWLGASINDYSLDVSHDLLDTEEERIVSAGSARV